MLIILLIVLVVDTNCRGGWWKDYNEDNN